MNIEEEINKIKRITKEKNLILLSMLTFIIGMLLGKVVENNSIWFIITGISQIIGYGYLSYKYDKR